MLGIEAGLHGKPLLTVCPDRIGHRVSTETPTPVEFVKARVRKLGQWLGYAGKLTSSPLDNSFLVQAFAAKPDKGKSDQIRYITHSS